MNVVQLISKKRDGHELTESEISHLVKGFSCGEIPKYQMAAFCMAVFFRGMSRSETVVLTAQMLESGVTLSWNEIHSPIVDKHSTGGVGDKISIPLAPILTCLGLKVPMISGRGLGATGGTLDKLESIPGFRTNLDLNEIKRVTNEVGCVIAGASKELAPADRELYALRDVTATVPSIPLITASILSKKLSAGLDALVLDVKWGSGAFMKTVEDAKALANSLVEVGTQLGVKVSALITDMNQPLGRMVGNAVEVLESIDILKGNGPDDVTILTDRLAAHLSAMVKVDQSEDDMRRAIESTIDSGKALETFERMVAAQGGKLGEMAQPYEKTAIVSRQDGFVERIDAEAIGWLLIEMDGGRKKVGDTIDHRAGFELLARIGDRIEKGQPVAHMFSSNKSNDQMESDFLAAITLSDEPVAQPPLVVEVVAAQ